MRKKLLSILTLNILVASTLVGCNQASPFTLTILSITEGNVFVMKAGMDDWIEGEVGMSLEVGDTIKTSDGSGAEITFSDGSTIELQAGAEIEIASLDISADTGVTTITLMQTIGTTISRVTKLLDPASSYEIETPTGVAAVRGSMMIVTVGGDGTTWTTNQEGNIWFIGQGVELQVPEGQTCISISGEPPELMPLAQDDTAITDEDNPVTVNAPGVLNNDSNPHIGNILTVISVDTNGTVGAVTACDADGSFTYDPNGQFEYLQTGNSTTDSFTYTVSYGNVGTDTATVTVIINGVNDVPTDINLDNSSVAEDQYYGTVVGNFSTIDPDTGDTFTYSLVSGEGDDNNTSFMIVDSQLQTINSFDYETKNYCSIRVRSTDSGMLYYEESFIITVTNVNEPPVNYPPMALDDSATTSQNTSVTIDVLSNDSDFDGDTLAVDSVTQGTSGSATNSGNDVTYTPDPYFTGTDSFTYTVSDSNGGTDTATVTVTVTVIETTARIRITVDQGPIAPIYVQDTTTGEMVVDGNVVASATIQVAGEHSYCVWVGGDATRYVNSCPDSWSGVGTETACGKAATGVMHPVHFTQSTPS